MNEIKITYNPNGDTRTLDHFPKYDEVLDACKVHRENMKVVLSKIGTYMINRGIHHDDSVVKNFDEYYEAVLKTYKGESSFKESRWYKDHFEDEQFRLIKDSTKDATLLDVIEYVCDSHIKQNKAKMLSKDEIYQIYLNTIKATDEAIEVVL